MKGKDVVPEDDKDRQIRALRDRLSRLSEAALRINESLDFDTVLQGVLDSARALTGARYSVLILRDDAGSMRELLGSGMTPEEGRVLWPEPDRTRFFEYISRIETPLRLTDFHAYAAEHGLGEFPPAMTTSSYLSFLAAPMRHRGEHLGAIYVDEKLGEFTAEDEECMVMFASQAAMVIANARRYRDEQRARTNLEVLLDTSPVGVAVFNARTGAPISYNREVVRVLEYLRAPDDPAGKLPEVFTVRREDGQEINLLEFTSTELMKRGETVRAEEMELTNSEGQSVSVLMNATPIRSRQGEVESFVVTLQDMTPLQEMERLRADFLAMVSHELRTPLAAVKGSVTTLLDFSGSLKRAEMVQFFRIIDAQSDRMRSLISDLLDVARIETGSLSLLPEPTELTTLADEVRDSFRGSGHRHGLQIELARDLPWVMADRERMAQVLDILLADAARHSPESSTIRISAERDEFHVAVSVTDDGRGIPAENLPNLFRKFSRIGAEQHSGDTGLGLAVCKGIVEAHGGRIWAESGGAGLGTRFSFTIPAVEASGYVSPGAPREDANRVARGPAREQLRVLAVDDDLQALRHIREALADSGFAIVATSDPGDVPRLMQQEKPHLALLDLMLPGVDGVDLMADIRETADIPVIFVTGYGQDRLVVRAFEAGADDYVVKPFSPRKALNRALMCLVGQRGEQ